MTQEEEITLVHQILSDYLTAKKRRQTIERKKIVDCIFAHEGHFTPDDIYEEMKNLLRVSRATIYNTFEMLVECHLIVCHCFLGNRIEYEKITDNATHHHRICTKCGMVKEFTDKKIRNALKNRAFTTFDTECTTVYLYGICNKCKRKQKKLSHTIGELIGNKRTKNQL